MIYDVFHVFLLKQNTSRRGRVDNKTLLKLEKNMKFEARGDKEYEVKIIIDSLVYGQHANNNKMPGFSYLVL